MVCGFDFPLPPAPWSVNRKDRVLGPRKGEARAPENFSSAGWRIINVL